MLRTRWTQSNIFLIRLEYIKRHLNNGALSKCMSREWSLAKHCNTPASSTRHEHRKDCITRTLGHPLKDYRIIPKLRMTKTRLYHERITILHVHAQSLNRKDASSYEWRHRQVTTKRDRQSHTRHLPIIIIVTVVGGTTAANCRVHDVTNDWTRRLLHTRFERARLR